MRTAVIPLLILLLIATGCEWNRLAVLPSPVRSSGAPNELSDRAFLMSVLRYLYRWHLDGSSFAGIQQQGEFDVWVREVDVEADPEDHGRFGEIWIPGVDLMLSLKKSDYSVPERHLVLQDSMFKVRSVIETQAPPAPREKWKVVRLQANEILADLHQTRADRVFPDDTLDKRMRDGLASYLAQHHQEQLEGRGPQTFHVAPISPVCNEVWVYWEEQRWVLRFAADGDLSNPGIWQQVALHLRVVSLEDPASSATGEHPARGLGISRECAGRFLYNCVVLGKRFTLSFSAPTALGPN